MVHKKRDFEEGDEAALTIWSSFPLSLSFVYASVIKCAAFIVEVQERHWDESVFITPWQGAQKNFPLKLRGLSHLANLSCIHLLFGQINVIIIHAGLLGSLGRFCVFPSGFLLRLYPTAVVSLQRYVADLGRAWLVLIVCAGVAPFILGFVFLILMRFLAGLMTWFFVIGVNLLLIAVVLYTYAKGTADYFGRLPFVEPCSNPEGRRNAETFFGIGVYLLLVTLVLYTYVMAEKRAANSWNHFAESRRRTL